MKEPKVIQEWFFYIVECRDKSLYCGITVDLNARLKKHNDGTGSAYTAAHRPVTLVYFEKFNNGSDARKREAQVKCWPREKKISLIAGFPRLRSE